MSDQERIAALTGEYYLNTRNYPSEVRRYERDMGVVYRARAFLTPSSPPPAATRSERDG